MVVLISEKAEDRIRLLLFVLLGCALILRPLAARAVVELSGFVIEPEDGEVLLDWQTASEKDFTGFYVRHSLQSDGNYTQWDRVQVFDRDSGQTVEFIPARDEAGATYRFSDRNAENGVSACYALEAVNVDIGNQFFPPQPECVTPGPLATPMPTQTLTPKPTSTPGANSTSTPTSTPTATQTILPSPTILASASGTITPSDTVTDTVAITQTLSPTPWPTYLPTLTQTPTETSTPTRTPTRTPTPGLLFEATLAPDARPGSIARLFGQVGLTLGESLLALAAVLALGGGILFAGLIYVVLRWVRR